MKNRTTVKTNCLSNNPFRTSIKNTAFKMIAATALVAGACSTHALDRQTEKEIAVGTAVVAGTVVAGPIGGFVAGLTADLFTKNSEIAKELKDTEKEVNIAENTINELENEISTMESNLAYLEAESTRLEETLMTRLEFQVLFRTGKDLVSEFDKERIVALVEYLNRNPELSVRLQGHTDQRGTEEYNNVLAKYRADSVANALMLRGIHKDRITTESYGSSMATAAHGDHEGYALDRRVNIEVFNTEEASNNLASLNRF